MPLIPPLLALAVLIAIAWLGAMVVRGAGRLQRLADAPVATGAPAVDIVVAARNEADGIERGVRSLLAQELPGASLRVIAVDDRSEDGTGAILERIAAEDARLTVRHVKALPPGWLGKNHALWLGAREAGAEWLLFTDADVVMAPDAVARAVGEAQRQGLDHLSVMPRVNAESPLLRILVIQFALSFLGYFRPWLLEWRNAAFAGVGAFNLARTALYRATGGHESIAMTPLDDVLLARLLRRAGGRSRLLYGEGRVQVAWYADAAEMVRAFGKNGFAAFDYRVHRLVLLTGAMALLGLGPWLGLFAPDGPTRIFSGLAVVATFWVHGRFARASGWPWATALLAPVGTALSLWMWWRASVRTLWTGAVEWRGTRYPLAELRAAHDRIMQG